jgi:hypothetical protein
VLDPVAEKAVANLEKFLKDLSPAGKNTHPLLKVRCTDLLFAERSRVKLEVRLSDTVNVYLLTNLSAKTHSLFQSLNLSSRIFKMMISLSSRYVF